MIKHLSFAYVVPVVGHSVACAHCCCFHSTGIWDCASNPCMHGATCHDGDAGLSFVCTCAQGYIGSKCETGEKICAGHPAT